MKIGILLITVFFILNHINCMERAARHCREGVYNSLGENPYLALCAAALSQPDINTNPYVVGNALIMCDRYLKQKERCDDIPWNQE